MKVNESSNSIFIDTCAVLQRLQRGNDDIHWNRRTIRHLSCWLICRKGNTKRSITHTEATTLIMTVTGKKSPPTFLALRFLLGRTPWHPTATHLVHGLLVGHLWLLWLLWQPYFNAFVLNKTHFMWRKVGISVSGNLASLNAEQPFPQSCSIQPGNQPY